MTASQWPQQPELVPFHRRCHAAESSGANEIASSRGPKANR
jgi:hypothetical protein